MTLPTLYRRRPSQRERRALAALALLPAVAAAACTRGDRPATAGASAEATPTTARGAATDTPCGPVGAAADSAEAIPVNRGSHGMAARVRWVLSPDRCALLVVEDPADVEADAIPNGFVLASERGPTVVQRDSVWDVAPSPDWTRLAYGRAWSTVAGERDSIPAEEWQALARRVGLPADVVRRGAFPTSGMTVRYGVARPVILDVAPDSAARGARALPTTGGWRVAWTRDGGALVVGDRPGRSQDQAPPEHWTVVDAGTPAARSASQRARSLDADVERAAVAWVEGPTIDVSVRVDTSAAPPIAVDGGGRVESSGGTIRLVGPSGARTVGPGVALAATRGGRFIAALVPVAGRREYDQPVQLVVYRAF